MNYDERDPTTLPPGSTASPGKARRPQRKLVWVLLGALVLLAGFLLPPLVNLGRYKSRITQLMAASFGRPVRLSAVELRLLPWPGFVLTDLTVAEDPAYGAEPVLHADTVTANILLLPLWRGRLQIGSISVDEATLNVVRAGPGTWNLDPLFRTAAARPGSPLHAPSLPYLEATNSRINFKNGAEKLPFSLMNTDLSFWQQSPNEWRIRLRGQPARTDVTLDLADAGIVQVEATLGRASTLHLMPVHADGEWRQGQLGQLSRLFVGSDKGWRGDLTGELHLDGTPDAARITVRLRAANVHREEFAPTSPLDFDANCSFVYRYGLRAIQHLNCNSPLGDGHLRLTGEVPGGKNTAPEFTAVLDHLPVGAGLDLLRTMRSGIDPSLEATGTVSGQLIFDDEPEPDRGGSSISAPRAAAPSSGPLKGALTVDGFSLSGGTLSQPLSFSRFVLQPADSPARAPLAPDASRPPNALLGDLSVPAGGASPLQANLRFTLNGYQAEIHGQAGIARARQIEHTAGMGDGMGLDGLAGDPLTVNLRAAGPWLLPDDLALPASGATPQPDPANADTLAGTVALHGDRWQPGFLAIPVAIEQATLHVSPGQVVWDPIQFSYGLVKGKATLALPRNCPLPGDSAPSADCQPQLHVQFGALNAATVQAAFLGAQHSGTLISDLLDRLHPASVPSWPQVRAVVTADALDVGPLALRQVAASLQIAGNKAQLSGFRAFALGGQLSASGSIQWGDSGQPQPSYTIAAQASGLTASAVGQLLGSPHWSGGPFNAGGTVELSGFTAKALAASAQGDLHFDWQKGTLPAAPAQSSVPPAPETTRFTRWTGTAHLANNAIVLGDNRMLVAGENTQLKGEVRLGDPLRVALTPAPEPGQEMMPAGK